MIEFERILDLNKLLQKKSYFLLGPRQVGKSYLIKKNLNHYPIFDLLNNDLYIELSRNIKLLRERIEKKEKIVIIDEIQKIPHLLDEVHWLIENRRINFLLTGSSARKLRRGEVNLLGGRARNRFIHPLVYKEIKNNNFDLLKVMQFGSIPSIYLSDEPREDLSSYVSNYLQLEIMQEGYTRNLPAFSRFLEIAALSNGKIINYNNIANDAQIPATTTREYFSILIDTLIGFELPAWRKTKKRKATATSKFYFFDQGVARFIQGRGKIDLKSPDFGDSFEAWIHHELRSYIDYNPPGKLNYWRSTSGFEVDFIFNEGVAIEVKAKQNITKRDLKGLRALKEENFKIKCIVVGLNESIRYTEDNITIYPWKDFLDDLWSNKF